MTFVRVKLVTVALAAVLVASSCMTTNHYTAGQAYGQPVVTIHSLASSQILDIHLGCQRNIACLTGVLAQVTVTGVAGNLWREAWDCTSIPRGFNLHNCSRAWNAVEDLAFVAYVTGNKYSRCLQWMKLHWPDMYPPYSYSTVRWYTRNVFTPVPGGLCHPGVAF